MSSISVNTITDASGGSTTSINGFTPSVSNMAGRNRIINGDMRIDQRNAGAAVSVLAGSSQAFITDRFYVQNLGSSAAFSCQRVTDAPAGFTNSLKVTVSTGATVLVGDSKLLAQHIEGYNVADFGFGAVGATSITISFWVKSSLTGTFSACYLNGAGTRVYGFNFNIIAANTWEQKAITITGDTTGTWPTDNSLGARLQINLGSGNNHLQPTAGVWVGSGGTRGVQGSVSLSATTGATFYITGVQLEAGSVATPFEHRQYGQELALCQRYLPAWNFTGLNQPSATGVAYSTTATVMNLIHPVQTRVPPTGISVTGSFNSYTNYGGNSGSFSSIILGSSQGTYSSSINCTGGTNLVQGNATILLSPSGTSQILLTGCEL